MRNLERTKSFYVTSYLVYMLSRNIKYKGPIRKGEVGNKQGQHKVYECYLQLHLHEKAQYRRVNDIFTMCLTRLLQGGVHKRLSKEAMSLVEKYKSWFIQFPTFTYIRIQGFTSEPYKLLRYRLTRWCCLR